MCKCVKCEKFKAAFLIKTRKVLILTDFAIIKQLKGLTFFICLIDCVFEKILHSSERPDVMIQMLDHELKTDPSILFSDLSLSQKEEKMETYKKMKS